MKSSVKNLVLALSIAIMAAVGGGLAVFSEFDDAPGGVLLGLLLIIGAVVVGMSTAQRRTT